MKILDSARALNIRHAVFESEAPRQTAADMASESTPLEYILEALQISALEDLPESATTHLTPAGERELRRMAERAERQITPHRQTYRHANTQIHMSEAVKAAAVQQVRDGSSFSDVARAIHVSASSVGGWCRRAGVRSSHSPGGQRK